MAVRGVAAWQVGTAVVAVCATGLLVWTLWRRRDQPAGRSLWRVAAVLLSGGFSHLLAVSPVGTAVVGSSIVEASRLSLQMFFALCSTSVAAFFWVVFVLRYTGRERLLTRSVYAALVCVPLLTVGTGLASLVTAETTQTVGGLFITTYYLSGTLLLIMAAVVIRPSLGRGSLPLGQGSGFAGALVALYLGPIAASFFQTPSLFPLGLLAATASLGYVLYRHRPFQRLPIARAASRDRIIEEMSEAVLVLDETERIRDLNGTAARTLDCSQSGAVGRHVEEVAPSLTAPDAEFVSKTDTDRWLSVSKTDVTDEQGRQFGRLLVCRDVTERRTREDRLQFVTQVLATTLHDRMTAVATAADKLVSGELTATDEPPAVSTRKQAASDIRATATDVATLVARTRELERALADGIEGDRVDLSRVVEDAASAAADGEGQTLSVSVPDDPPHVRFNEQYLRITVEALSSTALDRARDTVDIELSATAERVTIRFRDDGPAPDDGPTAGHDIWLATTVADTLDGEATVDAGPDGGRVVTVSLPKQVDGFVPPAPEREYE